MFNQLTVSQAQEQLPRLSQTIKNQPAIITEDGSPTMIVFGINDFLSYFETAEIMADTEFLEHLQAGIYQAEKEEYFDLADVEAELALQ